MANPFLGLPVSILQTQLNAYLAAHLAIATTGQSYSIEGRTLTRANLADIEKTIERLNSAIQMASGRTSTRVIPNFR
jgi:Fic family protein